MSASEAGPSAAADTGERKRPLLALALRALATAAILWFILSRLDLAELGSAMLRTGR